MRIATPSRRSRLDGAVGTVAGYGRTRYLVRIDDDSRFGRYAGAWMRCPESILTVVAIGDDEVLPSSRHPHAAADGHDAAPAGVSAPSRPRTHPRFTRSTPEWVRELVERVLTDHDAPLREFVWRPATNGRSPRTLGRGSRARVTIYDNRDAAQQRMTVLHELAHVIDDYPNHGPRFWDVCWALYRDYGVDLDAAFEATARRRSAHASYRRVIGKP